MVVGLLLDVTLDIGYWAVTRVGGGVVAILRYFASEDAATEPLPAIEASKGTDIIAALDAALVLRSHGALDDDTYVDVVRSVLESSGQGIKKKSTAPSSTLVPQSPMASAPSAPPPYQAQRSNSKLNLEG